MLTVAAGAGAEMGEEEYQSQARPLSAVERAELQRRLEQEQAEAAQRRSRQETLERQRQLALQAWLAARPAEERLLRERCTPCHGLGVVEPARHGRLGWTWTIARMRWWHGAQVDTGEIVRLAAHLARRAREGRPAVEAPPDPETLPASESFRQHQEGRVEPRPPP
ncbi:hypothetical protein Tsedi_00228 [Tepidimonas sediminis]|uniref:Uncharacterized protein n=2 Tax=Tepidimonas sediminis TaxID=2588941 RepID=A0A554WUZ7_9BURK|nr:hypothetical protein Tsedi_00228 [Tepidimonas sediminis]